MHTALWAVNANWNDDGWNVNANPVSNPNQWNADNHVVSRNSLLSPSYLLGRGFAKYTFTPASGHSPNLLNSTSEFLILFVRY